MPPRTIYPEKRAEIAKFFLECHSIHLTAQRFGYHQCTIRLALEKAGVDWGSVRIRKQIPNRATKNRSVVLAMVKEDRTLMSIVAATGAAKQTIRDLLVREGIEHKFVHDKRREKNPNWGGGRSVDSNGYILIRSSDHPNRNRAGYVFEHRLVMEKHLGRYLTRSEVVHHKNDVRNDNRIENLELFETNGHHLIASRKGKMPNWTQDGILRMKEGIARSAIRRNASTRVKSARDVRLS